MKQIPTPTNSCPFCRHEFDTASTLDKSKAVPLPGDTSICIECGEFLVFAEDLTTRAMTDAEKAHIRRNIRNKWLAMCRASALCKTKSYRR